MSLGGVRLTQDANALKRRVGLVPQDLALYDELSAWANLQLFGGLYGLGAEHFGGAPKPRLRWSASPTAATIASRPSAAA